MPGCLRRLDTKFGTGRCSPHERAARRKANRAEAEERAAALGHPWEGYPTRASGRIHEGTVRKDG